MAIEQLPIFTYFDRQRFTQFGAMDCANWYGIQVQSGKKQQALYPAMGRKHISSLGVNRLLFDAEPRAVFRTINYFYVVDGTRVYQFDRFYNRKLIGSVSLGTQLWFAYLPVGTDVYALLTDENRIYQITESGSSVTMDAITDPNAPGGSTTGGNPLFVAAFGNRFVVSVKDSPQFYLSTVNLTGGLSGCFSFGSPAQALFAQASGVIGQFAVLHNQLFIFTDFVTDIWANIPTQITVGGITREFPWKLNTSFNFDYGIADPFSLSVGFGRIVWLAKNQDGLVSFMVSTGQAPEDMSSQAVNVVLEGSTLDDQESPFIEQTAEGFLYQYENTIFYRVSAAQFLSLNGLAIAESTNALEFNFTTGTWSRVIELNGERSRIRKHIFINNKHLVTVAADPAMYEMAGNIYHNELRNPDQPNGQAADAFIKYPMRYELVTQQLCLPDYAEFIDDYLEIDFVFGDKTFYKNNAPFANTTYLITEDSTPQNPVYLIDEDGAFLITEDSNTPQFSDAHYNALFKPHIELYYSDDGGVTFSSADLREFSPLGAYRWRMRWYELGASRNRCYKLVCVSSAPIVILGAVRNTRRASGGAN